MKRRKPLACESCYLSRVKCVYASDAAEDAKCERCSKQNRKCVPRIVVRGKGTASEDGSFTRELDLNAYKALEILEDNPHLTQHYNGAAAFVKTYKALGYSAPPGVLKSLVNTLYLVATKDKSVGRLHAATTLAVATGVEIDMAMLNSKDYLASDTEKLVLQDIIHKRFLHAREAGSCFIVRHDNGDRDVIATPDFEEMFCTAASVAAEHVRNSEPHLKVWRQFVAEPKDADSFASKVIQSMIKADLSSELPNTYLWDVTDSRVVSIKDNHGCKYTACMYEAGCFTKHGFLNYFIFGFKEIEPCDDRARARLEEMKRRMAFAPPHVPGNDPQPGRHVGSQSPTPTYGAPPPPDPFASSSKFPGPGGQATDLQVNAPSNSQEARSAFYDGSHHSPYGQGDGHAAVDAKYPLEPAQRQYVQHAKRQRAIEESSKASGLMAPGPPKRAASSSSSAPPTMPKGSGSQAQVSARAQSQPTRSLATKVERLEPAPPPPVGQTYVDAQEQYRQQQAHAYSASQHWQLAHGGQYGPPQLPSRVPLLRTRSPEPAILLYK